MNKRALLLASRSMVILLVLGILLACGSPTKPPDGSFKSVARPAITPAV
jgi:hypothetical protein